MTAWTVTTTTVYSALPFVSGDSVTVNSTGILTYDLANPADATVINGITISAVVGGIHIQSAGTRIKIADTYAITINEGGQLISLGTSGSRCAITGGGNTATNYILNYGKLYCDYTDISMFFYGIYAAASNMGTTTIINSTLTSYRTPIYSGTGYSIHSCTIINSTISASGYRCIQGKSIEATAINSLFDSGNQDNYLLYAISNITFQAFGCLYKSDDSGTNPINADDISYTGQDIDIRIYEASTVTVAGNLAGVSVSPDHPSLDSMGMLYDSTNYMKVPGFLSPDQTNASGVSTVYLLQKTAYWPSGLAVGSRTWKYWSDSGQAETGDNQKWTVTMAKSGYVTYTYTQWAGAAVSGTLTATSNKYNTYMDIFTFSDLFYSAAAVKFARGATVYSKFTFTPLSAYSVAGGDAVADLYDIDWNLIGRVYTSSASFYYEATSNIFFETDTTDLDAGVYYIEFIMTNEDNTFYEYVEFEVEAVPTTPVISSPAISAASISQDEAVVITADIAEGYRAWVDFIKAGVVEYSQKMELTGTAGECVVRGRKLSVGSYAAGEIEIRAVESTGLYGAVDATLELDVTASGTSYHMQVAIALQALIQDDSRFSAIDDGDIIVATDDEVIGTLPKFPAIVVIPEFDDASLPHSATLRKHKTQAWILVVSQNIMAKLDTGDITEPSDVHEWVRAAMDLMEEENEDPDERLGGLVQTIHATRANPKIIKAMSLYVAYIQVNAEINAK